MPVNVRSYGAAGDGVRDDGSAIQQAIAAAIDLGVAVEFPPGSYRIANLLAAPQSTCACGHGQRLHNPCSPCECPLFRENPPAKVQKYPKRATL